MVFSKLSTIPEDGSTFDITMNGLDIQVVDISDHRVEKALIRKVKEPASEDGESSGPEARSGQGTGDRPRRRVADE